MNREQRHERMANDLFKMFGELCNPIMQPTIDRIAKVEEQAPTEDRLHRIELTLEEVVKFGEDENEHMLNLFRTCQRQIIDLKRTVSEMEHEIGCLSAHVAALEYGQAG